MRQLSSAGQQAIQDTAQRHGFSVDAVASMLDAVISGNGTMAQFNHPEFSGSGQWMSGGMTMVSDMFNNHLKGRVDSLCGELAQLLANQPGLVQTESFQSQSQGSGSAGGSGDSSVQSSDSSWQARQPDPYQNTSSLFMPSSPDWWGTDLRWPNSTGSQDGSRYAYFAQACRLAIEEQGKVTIYDTLDHQIGGFSQQQAGSAGMTFSSQYGQMNVGQLPVVSVNGLAAPAPPPDAPAGQPPYLPTQANVGSAPSAPSAQQRATEADVFSTLERLAELTRKGVLTDQEYQTKKAELLARL